jgi:leucyl-tRNA synthetase
VSHYSEKCTSGGDGSRSRHGQRKSDLEGTDLPSIKPASTGVYAINQMNDEVLPIWTANCVMYGSDISATMAALAPDDRDAEFGEKYDTGIEDCGLKL